MAELTTKQRWDRAIAEVRSAGVVVMTNVDSKCNPCPRSCGMCLAEDGRAESGIAYFFSSQDRQALFQEAGDVHPDAESIIYFSWGNGAGQILADGFQPNGFEVRWDGTDERAVGVVLREEETARQ